MLRTAALLAGSLAGACGAILDLSPLSFVEADSMPDASDAMLVDGTFEPPTDAGPDARSRCTDKKPHDFCDDFESITGEIQDRWNKRKEVSGTGKIEAVAFDGAPSPSTVFRSRIDRDPDGGTSVHIARISKQDSPWARSGGGAQPGVRIAFEVYFDDLDDTFDTTIVNVTIGVAPRSEDVLQVSAKRDGTSLVALRLVETYALDGTVRDVVKGIPTRVPMQTWTRIELEVQERASGLAGGANLTVGTTTEPYALSSISRASYFRADLGASVGSYAGARAVILYDDVSVDYNP